MRVEVKEPYAKGAQHAFDGPRHALVRLRIALGIRLLDLEQLAGRQRGDTFIAFAKQSTGKAEMKTRRGTPTSRGPSQRTCGFRAVVERQRYAHASMSSFDPDASTVCPIPFRSCESGCSELRLLAA